MVSLADKFEELSKHYKTLAAEARQLEVKAKELEDKERKLSFFRTMADLGSELPEKLGTGHNIATCTYVKSRKLLARKKGSTEDRTIRLKFKVGDDEIGCEPKIESKQSEFKKLLSLKDKSCRIYVTKSGKRYRIRNIAVKGKKDWESIWSSEPKFSSIPEEKIFDPSVALIKKRINDIPALMADICCKYDIKLEKTKFNQTVYRTEIDPALRQEILDSATKMWNNGKSGYRKLSTVVAGLYGEQCVINVINSIYDYFKINRKLTLNTKNYRFTGDGATDFVIEGLACDAKYRNSTKNDGMATKVKDLRADVLLLTTGATDYNDLYFESAPRGHTHVVYFTGFTDKDSFTSFAIRNGLAYSDLMDHPFTESGKYYGMDPYKKLKSANDFVHLFLTKILERLEKYGNI